MTPTLFGRILGDSIYLSKYAQRRVEVIRDKMCILSIQETFDSSSICQKCQNTQIKVFLCFELKRDGDCDHKTALNRV